MPRMTMSQFNVLKDQVTPDNYLYVYWSYFWQRGTYGAIHMLVKPVDHGYSTRDPDERKALCGEKPSFDYREVNGSQAVPNGVCLRCLRSAALREQKGNSKEEESYARCQVVFDH